MTPVRLVFSPFRKPRRWARLARDFVLVAALGAIVALWADLLVRR